MSLKSGFLCIKFFSFFFCNKNYTAKCSFEATEAVSSIFSLENLYHVFIRDHKIVSVKVEIRRSFIPYATGIWCTVSCTPVSHFNQALVSHHGATGSYPGQLNMGLSVSKMALKQVIPRDFFGSHWLFLIPPLLCAHRSLHCDVCDCSEHFRIQVWGLVAYNTKKCCWMSYMIQVLSIKHAKFKKTVRTNVTAFIPYLFLC